MRESVERLIACLKEEKKLLNSQTQQCMAEQDTWQEQTEILGSAPGVGMVIATTLLAELPEPVSNLINNNCPEAQDSCCTYCCAA